MNSTWISGGAASWFALTPSALASKVNTRGEGWALPSSYFESACLVTAPPNAAASASKDKPRASRNCLIRWPSMVGHPSSLYVFLVDNHIIFLGICQPLIATQLPHRLPAGAHVAGTSL